MKPSLQMNIHQQLTMTPQLQQSLKLLQLSTLELQQEIQHQLEINPLLEIAANEDINLPQEKVNDDEYSDFQWSHLYTTQESSRQFNQSDYPYEILHCTTIDLKDHLRWQLNLTQMTDQDKFIAINLIDAINEDGFLTLTLDDLYADLTKNISSLSKQECEVVRHRLQRFDPIGCVTVNLAETLLVQLEQLPSLTPHLQFAKKMIQDNIDLIGQHNYGKLMKIYHSNENTLNSVVKLIQHLNPRPGNAIQTQTSEYIIPDLIVKRINQQWCVELHTAVLPKISINDNYITMIKSAYCQSAHRKDDTNFLKNNLQEARIFLKNIRNRQETLLNVARYIVQFQKDFFETGDKAMKPLTLDDIAQALHLHESTISRVTAQKFIHTPRGLLELKYFLSGHIPSVNGDHLSSLSIRAHIKQLIMQENSKKPLSDTIIARTLSQQGIKIARRTVTKYRELMGFAPFNERKRIEH